VGDKDVIDFNNVVPVDAASVADASVIAGAILK